MTQLARQFESSWPIRLRAPGSRRGTGGLAGLATVVMLIVATTSGLWWWTRHRGDSTSENILLHTVVRDDFELSVTERGEIESYDVTEVRSLVKANNSSGNAILRIVPEGTLVTTGDFLVELDSSALVAQRTTQKIAVNSAKALEVEARNMYDTAVIAKREYLEGTYLQERQTIESEVFVAEENLNRAREYYAYSRKLASKGYVNELQLEADRFAVAKAQKDLEAAQTKLKVLDEFTKPKMLSQLESDILIAKAKLDSSQSSHELELDKLAELDDQIAKCTITAPQDGVVKYAHLMNGRGDQEFVVQEGTIVRERQTIIRLPNADSMRVNLTVNESLIQYMRPGLPAAISPVGFGDRVMRGAVEKVNQYAEPTGWRQANVKEYKAYVSIDEPAPDLRAGMTASVTIRCAEVRDALQVPVQAIYAHGDKFYSFAYDQGSWEAREIKPGPTNDKFFVVEHGLQEGDQVALNPRAYVSRVSLPKLSPEQAQRAVPQRLAGIGEAEDSEATTGEEGVPEGDPGEGRPAFRPPMRGEFRGGEGGSPAGTNIPAGPGEAPAGQPQMGQPEEQPHTGQPQPSASSDEGTAG